MKDKAVAAKRSPVYFPLPMLTGSQIRAARALLNWTSQRLAAESGVSYATVSRAEQTDDVPNVRAGTLVDMQRTFQNAGVIFLSDGENRDGGPGVRLRQAASDPS